MDSNAFPIVVAIDDDDLQNIIITRLVNEGFTTITISFLEEAQSLLKTTSISAIVATDQQYESLFKALPNTIPTLTLIRPSSSALQAFDQIRRPPYAIHEYLTIPVALEDVVSMLRTIIEAR